MDALRNRRTAETWSAAAGILMLVCTMGGFALMTAGGLVARPGGTKAEVMADLAEPVTWPAQAGLFLDVVGSLLLVVFAARVATAIRPGLGPEPMLPVVVMGTALLAVAASFVDKAAFQVLAQRAGEDLPAANGVLLVDLVGASFRLFQAAFAAFVLSAAIGLVHQSVGPAWLGRAGIGVGVLGLASVAFPPDSAVAQLPFPLLVLWVVTLSVVLMRVHTAPAGPLPEGAVTAAG